MATYTITRCCGHAEIIETLPNILWSQLGQDRLEAGMCWQCQRETDLWLADRFAERQAQAQRG